MTQLGRKAISREAIEARLDAYRSELASLRAYIKAREFELAQELRSHVKRRDLLSKLICNNATQRKASRA